MWLAERPPTPRQTFGYYRAEILAALVNGATLVAVALYIFVEAYRRLRQPPEVEGGLMLVIAAGGLLINLMGLWLLNAERKGSLNLRGAWLHVLTDALGSTGAIVGAFLIWKFAWYWADPAVSILIGLLVIFSSWALMKEAVSVLMEGAPGQIDVDRVRDAIMQVPGVGAVHDLHVWSLTTGMVALSGHVRVRGRDSREVLAGVTGTLGEDFGIYHTTIQLEPEGFDENAPVGAMHP